LFGPAQSGNDDTFSYECGATGYWREDMFLRYSKRGNHCTNPRPSAVLFELLDSGQVDGNDFDLRDIAIRLEVRGQ